MKKLWVMAVLLASAPAAADAPPQLKGPVPSAPLQEWITASDFPADTLKSVTAIGPASFALTISAKGRVMECKIERSSGSKPLDDVACYIFEQRGRFEAAVDSLGKTAIGVYRVDAQWAVAGQTAPAIPLVEMAVELRAMPQPLADPAYVDIAVAVDEVGKVDGCAPAEALNWAGQPIADRQQASNVLGDVPCTQVLANLRLEPAKTEKGKPVRSVQMATVLFMANAPALATAAAPAPPTAARPGPAAPRPTPPADPNKIVVEGRNIRGIISRPEVSVPYQGLNPVAEIEPVGSDAVLLRMSSGQWYRALLEPPCLGDATLIDDGQSPPMEPPGIAIIINDNGTFDSRSMVRVRVGPSERSPFSPGGECRILSVVESAPPRGWKPFSQSGPPKPPPLILPAAGPKRAPDGGPIHPVEWQERPTPAQFQKISNGGSGSGWILCQTANDYRVRDCRIISESPRLSGIANRMKLEAGKFRVRPPMVDGRPAIGAWVAIGFDFAAKRLFTLRCNPSSDRDPC